MSARKIARHYPPSLFWDADEVAYHLGWSASHWRKVVGEGKAPAPVRAWGKVLWPVAAVTAWSATWAGDGIITQGNPTVPPVDDEWDAE